MKEFYRDIKNSFSSFYVEIKDNNIIFIFKGYEQPFKYSFVINQVISELITFEKPFYNVYMDLLSYKGNIEGRF